ncbi:hypothetical protein [Massilimicrobiota timonensis]|uniref:hypothetical protein n=1 Tax=Massilimicrobiota timonensis TaxID=1776392 RepID=UPI00101DC75E|nr:hypothetical protein [Massilimicrobiota timonensis]HJA53580.1 hypothetical protein [Candidatus Massilimicrobiota merdigallinarum]
MKLLGLSSAFHFKAQSLALRWAKENLPKRKISRNSSFISYNEKKNNHIYSCMLPSNHNGFYIFGY